MEAANQINASRFLTPERRALVGSVLFHLLMVALMLFLPRVWERREQKPVEITWLDDTRSERQRRIVQTEKAQKSETAPEKAFLGEQNQRVDEERVSKLANRPAEKIGGTKQASRGKQKAQAAEASPLAKFAMPMIPTAQQEQERAAADRGPKWNTVGSRAADFVPGVKEGDRTALNTKEFVYYGYFQRIRERLDRAWIPLLREKLIAYYKKGRQLASEVDHVTQVVVTLNPVGEIVRVKIIGESGTEELDDAAVKAFNRAGPFPNPPRGIVDTRGEISIAWDFILKT